MYLGIVEIDGQFEWKLHSVTDNSQRGSQERITEKQQQYKPAVEAAEQKGMARQANGERNNAKKGEQDAEGERELVRIEKREAEGEENTG